MTEYKMKELKPVAAELNEAFGLDKSERIKIVGVKTSAIAESIISVCGEHESELSDIELTDEAEAVLAGLGIIELSEDDEEEETEDNAEDSDEEEEDAEESDEETDQELEDDDEDEDEPDEETDDEEPEEDEEADEDEEEDEEEEPDVPKLSKKIQKSAVKVASDLVKVLGITDDDGKNPLPKLKKMSFEKLHAEIVEMAGVIGAEFEDETGETMKGSETMADFEAATLEYFEAAGIEPAWPEVEEKVEAPKKGKGKGKGKKEDKPKAESKKKGADKKAKQEKSEKKDKPKKKAKKEKVMNRTESICRAFGKKALTKKELIEKSDAIYVEAGGSSNPKMATKRFDYIISGLLFFENVSEDNGKYKLA